MEEGGDGVLAASEASADHGSEPSNHRQAAVVELGVLVLEGLLLGLLVQLGEGGGVRLHIPGDLVLLLGGKHLEGGREQEHLRPALSGPSTGGDSANAVGHGLGDPIASGHEARQLYAEAGHQGVEHGKHGHCKRREGGRGGGEGVSVEGGDRPFRLNGRRGKERFALHVLPLPFLSLVGRTSAVLDLGGAVLVKLFDIPIGGEAKGVLWWVEGMGGGKGG